PILFCYTHPLPPRLYSLSLHDALPISALMVTILGACGSASEATPTPPAPGEVVWPAPDHPLALTVKAGLKPEPKESLTFHVHAQDRKSTRLNSSHLGISYAVFCLKKKK